MKAFCNPGMRRSGRRGTTVVEVAVSLPIFLIFVFGLIEYGRIQLVSNMLRASCRGAARYGSTEGVTTNDVESRVRDMLSASMDTNKVAVLIKDASVFDEDGDRPATAADFDAMPDIQLTTAKPRQLFLVRASITYNDIALVPMPTFANAVLTGQVFIRHE